MTAPSALLAFYADTLRGAGFLVYPPDAAVRCADCGGPTEGAHGASGRPLCRECELRVDSAMSAALMPDEAVGDDRPRKRRASPRPSDGPPKTCDALYRGLARQYGVTLPKHPGPKARAGTWSGYVAARHAIETAAAMDNPPPCVCGSAAVRVTAILRNGWRLIGLCGAGHDGQLPGMLPPALRGGFPSSG